MDQAGRTVVLPSSPARIVSLVPSATQTLMALGAVGRLAGRTDYDTASAVVGLPSVGGGLHPSGEVLLSLEPDLVVRFAGETDPETPARLDGLGIPHLAVRPDRIDDVREMIRLLGRVVGREGRAREILARQDAVLDSLRARTDGLAPVPVAFLVGGDPPWVAGAGTYIHELMALAGGENVFADLDRRYGGVGPEALLARSPEVILVVEGTALDDRLVGDADVRELPPLVRLPGPRLDDAARAVALALRPELRW